jgi:hypothetical protein
MKSLEDLLYRAQRSLPKVECDRVVTLSEGRTYEYVSAEKMMSICREVLLAQGILCQRETASAVLHSEYLAVVKSTFTMSFKQSDERVCIPRSYEGIAQARHGLPLDKAISAALTVQWSTFYRDLLQVPRFDASSDMREEADYVLPSGFNYSSYEEEEARVEALEAKSTEA